MMHGSTVSGVRADSLSRWLLVGLLVVLGLGLRMYRLDGPSFWVDEVIQVQAASQPVADIAGNFLPSARFPRLDQAPLSLLATRLFFSAENPEWSARLPSVIFGVLTVPALFVVSRKLSSHPLPLLAALFLVFSPLHLRYSQETRWYAQWVFLTTISYVAFLRARENGRLLAWTGYAVVTMLNIYTFVFSFVVVACQAFSAWLLHRRREDRTPFFSAFAVAAVIVAALALPVLWMIGSQVRALDPSFRLPALATLPYTLFAYAAGFSLGPTLAELHVTQGLRRIAADHTSVLLVFTVFLPLLAAGIHRLRQDRAAAAVLLPWLCGPPLMILLLAVLTDVPYRVRYTLAALPAFLLLVAMGTRAIGRAAFRFAAAGSVLACFLWSIANLFWSPQYGREDVRAAVAYVRATGANGSPVIAAGEIQPVVAYYGTGLPVVSARDCGNPVNQTGRNHARAGGEDATIWLLVGRDWDGQAESCLTALLRSHLALERREFPGLDLWRLQRRRQADLLDDAGGSMPSRMTSPPAGRWSG